MQWSPFFDSGRASAGSLFRLFIIGAGLLLGGSPLFGQAPEEEAPPPPPRYFDLNLNAQYGFPTGPFQEELSTGGYGVGGFLLLQVKRGVPVQAGLDGAWQRYERETLDYTQVIDGVPRDFRLATKVNVVTAHLVVRYQPVVDFPLWPFLDGLVGVKHLYTLTTLSERLGAGATEQLEVDVDKQDTAFSYGLAGGFQIRPFFHPAVRIELRCAYLPGASAAYFARLEDATGPFNDPLEAFEERRSPTTLVIPQIGITVDLFRAPGL